MKIYNVGRKPVPAGCVYIGRGSTWGNPFKIGRDGTRDQVIDKYEEWVKTNPLILKAMQDLKGKNLLCHCAPERCHGEVIIRILEGKSDVRYGVGRPDKEGNVGMLYGPVHAVEECLDFTADEGDLIFEFTGKGERKIYRYRSDKWRKLKGRS